MPANDSHVNPPRPVAGRSLLTGAVVAVLLVLAACRPESGSPRDRPLVVASFFPLYDFAREVAGTDAEVRCLVPPGASPHGEEATPGAARMVAEADLVILLGVGMDGWVSRLAGANGKTRVVEVHGGLATRSEAPGALEESAHGHAHPESGIDPHIWLDPVLAGEIVRRLADELSLLVPGAKTRFHERAEAYRRQLRELDRDFRDAIEGCVRRRVVTFHGAFGYLFARYDLEVAGVIEPFPGGEPSAAYLRQLVDLMRQLKLNVIFAEPHLPDRPARIIAQEIGGRVERLDPCETLLPDAPEATYLQRQRTNLATLKRVLCDNAP